VQHNLARHNNIAQPIKAQVKVLHAPVVLGVLANLNHRLIVQKQEGRAGEEAKLPQCNQPLLEDVKVWPGRGCSEEYCGTWDNWRCLEPGPELRRMKGTKHKAQTEVQSPAMLAEGMERRGIAGSKSNVIGS
jgi:hypothetical protein